MTTGSTRPRLRSLLLPTEHGGWGLSLEPGILGVLVAPGLTSIGLALFALFAFLADRPGRVVAGDLRRRRILARTRWAAGIATLYAVGAAAGLTLAAMSAAESFWWVLAAAVPLVVLHLALEARARTRSIVREIAGPAAIASVAAASAAATGAPAATALGLWLVLGVRVVVSVVLVRAQIRASKGGAPHRDRVLAAHALGAGLAVAGSVAGWVSWPAMAGIAVLGLWAVAVLARRPMRVLHVGISQMVLGMVVVAAAAIGYSSG